MGFQPQHPSNKKLESYREAKKEFEKEWPDGKRVSWIVLVILRRRYQWKDGEGSLIGVGSRQTLIKTVPVEQDEGGSRKGFEKNQITSD